MNGVNMADYFPIKNSYNPVVYMHKKFQPKEITIDRKLRKEENIRKKSFTQHFQERKMTTDKSVQYDFDKLRAEVYKTKVINNSTDKDPLMEQTIKFAKDIIPLTIPPSTNVSANPVYYTIKPSKKIKRKHEPREQNFEHDEDATFNKLKSKSVIKPAYKETYKCTEESFSGRESVSRSSKNNTSEDINQNKSLCSLSESSEQKHFKEEKQKKNKRNEMQKIIASESFEAIATEYLNTSSDAKIKLQFMNDKEKQSLYDNIRAPVVKIIKQCFSELDNKDVKIDLQYIETAIQNHANKLDSIIDKLNRIEKILDVFGRSGADVPNLNKKSSKLEELGQDIIDVKDDISSEEELAVVNLVKKRRGNTTSVNTVASQRDDAGRLIVDHLAKGENIIQNDDTSDSQYGVRPDPLNRIPARYCWTDAAKKN